MANDELEYLEPDFDPGSLTMPKLRSILVAHDIHYPSTAKKPQLVDLFNEFIAPKAKRLLSSRARTKRSARGIEDIESVASASTASDDDEDMLPRQSVENTPRRSSRRTSSRYGSEDPSVSAAPSARSSVARSSRQSSARRTMTPSDIDDDRSSVGTARPAQRSRKSLMSPTIKEEEEEEEEDPDVGSPFSSDNPFQSGSSPLGFGHAVPKSKKRRTLDSADLRPQRKVTPARRKTEDVARLRQLAKQEEVEESDDDEEDDDDEPTEEFTIEEQQELEEDQTVARRAGLAPARRSKRRSSARSALLTAPLAVLVAIGGAIGFLWGQEKFAVGFCGVGSPSSNWLGGYEIPEELKFLEPQCELCPPHAYCHANLEVTCEPDFVLVHHPLSLNGLLPLPPTCEPDSEKARKVQAVADRAVEELRDRNAKLECGELRDEEGKRVQQPEILESELKEAVASKRRRGMSQLEFEDLWQSAIGEITSRDEVVASSDGESGNQRLRSTSLANISFGCALRRSIRVALVRNLWSLIGVITVILSGFYARWTFSSRRSTEQRAKQLASHALDQLATQAAVHLQDRDVEPYISMGQLRDDVLRDEFSSKERQRLWAKVQQKVENNSNVRARLAEGRTGEVSRVWEWVGAVHSLQMEDVSGGVNRRKSGRYSIGPVVDSSPVRRSSLSPEKVDRRTWDEGRPIY